MTFRWLDFKITNRCNNNCVYCGVDHDPPSSSEVLSSSDINRAIIDALSLGFTHFALLGGEPSIREDINEILSSFKNCPEITLLIITNGLVFNQKMCKSAYASGAGTVKIVYSFDSFNVPNYKHQNPEEVLTHIDRTFKIAQGYNNNGLERSVEVHSVISKENWKDFSELIGFFNSKGIDISLGLVCPSEFGEGGSENEYNHFTYKELDTILDQLKNLRGSGLLNFANIVLLEYLGQYPYGQVDMKSSCRAGKDHIIVNFDGEVYPCVTESYRRGIRYGNITEECFKDIYPRMSKFRCESEFAPACWDHYLWNRLGEHIKGRDKK